MSSEPVRLFTYDHPLLARTLRGKLEAEKQKQIEANGNGYAQDWADYKHRTGVIAGLHCALLICEEAMKELGD